MKVGDLVRLTPFPGTPMKPNLGIVTYIYMFGDNEEVEVMWLDGDRTNARTRFLEVIND